MHQDISPDNEEGMLDPIEQVDATGIGIMQRESADVQVAPNRENRRPDPRCQEQEQSVLSH